MKIVHIQKSMPPAGNAAFRLHSAMRDNGIESYMLTLEDAAQKDFSISLTPSFTSKAVNAICRKATCRNLKAGTYTYSVLPKLGSKVYTHQLVKDADVIYLHWIAGNSMSLSDIEQLAKTGKPIICFMHDMWFFTGGCHYSFDCNQYENGCLACPMFKGDATIAKKQAKKKHELYAKYDNLHFVSPGQWLYNCASKSSTLNSKQIFRIPNLLDERIFKHIEKSVARNILNLPQNKYLITFGCSGGVHNRIKGWNYLVEAINRICNDRIEIVIYGCTYDKKVEEEMKYPVHFVGNLLDETMISLVCNSSDLFVTPSIAENYSLALIENLIVGTPVVAFDNTGNVELIKTGETGYLAKYKDTDDLRRGIEEMILHPITVQGWENFRAKDIVDMHLEVIESVN